MKNILKKIDMKLQKEAEHQAICLYAEAFIALKRYWNWGEQRLTDWMQVNNEAWNEARSSNEVSAIQLLDEETGIEIRIRETGESYKDLDYLNGHMQKYEINEITNAQYIYMRQKQIKWMGPQIKAVMYLSMHRKAGFGAERLKRLQEQMWEIEDEFKGKEKLLLNAAKKETGIDVMDKLRESIWR